MRKALQVWVCRVFVATCAVLLLGAAPSYGSGGPTARWVKAPSSAPVRAYAALADRTAMLVRARGLDGRVELHTYCSAVWVGPSTLITAAHCVEDEGPDLSVVTWRDAVRAVVTEHQPPMHSAVTVARDIVADVAVVQTHEAVSGHAVGGLGEIHAGEAIELMGHPLGAWYTYERGSVARVIDVHLEGLEMHVADVAVTVRPGNSGGCVWRGTECLGVVTRMNMSNGHGLVVGTRHVRELMAMSRVRVR